MTAAELFAGGHGADRAEHCLGRLIVGRLALGRGLFACRLVASRFARALFVAGGVGAFFGHEVCRESDGTRSDVTIVMQYGRTPSTKST